MSVAPSPPRDSFDLPLEKNRDTSSSSSKATTKEEHPRRFLRFPVTEDFVAYGGDEGTIAFVDRRTLAARQWEDDGIRAIAVSWDGRRVAVGLDSGLTQIFAYDDPTSSAGDEESSTRSMECGRTWIDPNQPHPFLTMEGQHHDSSRSFAGPCADAPIRDLLFLPKSYSLVVASESGLFVCNVETDRTTSEWFLQDEAAEQHDSSGIRGVACTVLTVEGRSSTAAAATATATASAGLNTVTVVLASLAMDGRLCLWDVSCSLASHARSLQKSSYKHHRTTNTQNRWTLICRESTTCITKRDVGEIMGSDAYDRSCRPVFLQPNLLGLPGELYLQLRRLNAVEDHGGIRQVQVQRSTNTNDAKANTNNNGAVQGHIESIVSMASVGEDTNDPYFYTTGRDGRVVLWKLPPTDTKDGTFPAPEYVQTLVSSSDASAPTEIQWIKTSSSSSSKGDSANNNNDTTELLFTLSAQAKVSVWTERSDFAPPVPIAAEPKATATATAAAAPHTKRVQTKANGDDDADDDDLFAEDNESSKPTTPKVRFIDDEAMDEASDNDAADAADVGHGTSTTPSLTQNRGASADDVAGGATGGPVDLQQQDDHGDDDDDDDDSLDAYSATGKYFGTHGGIHSNANSNTLATLDLPEPQPPFAPSATPLDEPRRFLCWNHVGAVTLHRSDIDNAIDHNDGRRGTVDINFTDSAVRRPIGFTDNIGFILGSLGEDGGIFATDLAEDDDDDDDKDNDDAMDVMNGVNLSAATKAALRKSQQGGGRGRGILRKGGDRATGSTIYFHRYESFASMREKDWYLSLPDGERALGCACGEGWAAVMTSRRFLRLYSSGGNQGRVIWLNGAPVSMAGRSRFLAVVYHDTMPLLDGTQKLAFMLVDAVAHNVLARGPVSCISTGSSLAWLGFSNAGSLMALDTDGMLSMLVGSSSSSSFSGSEQAALSWDWMPMLDTMGLRKSKDDAHWPITVHDGSLVCVPLKGGMAHPDAGRRPVTTTLRLRVPLARGSLTKTNALEEVSIRADVALNQKRLMHYIALEGSPEEDEEFEEEYTALSAQVDKVTLKMFATIVAAGKLERALDLVERLHLEKSFDLAMRIAEHRGKLVDLIQDAKDRKFSGPPEEEEDYIDDEQEEEEQLVTAGFHSRHQRISPDANQTRLSKRSFDNVEGMTSEERFASRFRARKQLS